MAQIAQGNVHPAGFIPGCRYAKLGNGLPAHAVHRTLHNHLKQLVILMHLIHVKNMVSRGKQQLVAFG
ncbi:hypothetical protein D3C86_2161600 [compost metagenome]